MKKKIFLSALVLMFGAIALISFKKSVPVSGKVGVADEDSTAYWLAEKAALDAIAYDTWVNDGMPGGEDVRKAFNHYCCKTGPSLPDLGAAARWVVNTGMGGRANPKHVHYINWSEDFGCAPTPCYTPKVKYWTSEACDEICNW